MGQLWQSSASGNTCRLFIMSLIKIVSCLILCLSFVSGRRQLRGNVERRGERSLVGTFPFNQASGQGQARRQLQHRQHHHEQHPAQGVRDSRQGSDGETVSFDQVAAVRPGRDGKKCIDKVEMIEELEYDEEVLCDHSYDKRCHTTYVTNYESQQEEDCEENYRKSCFIEYETIAFNETVQVCRTPLVKDCDVTGPEICRTEYESECWTKQETHNVEDDVVSCETVVEEKCEDETSGSKKPVKKYTPITACTKEPKELCAPAGCGFKQGSEECFDKVQTVVQDAPQEQCSLEPQRTCKHVTKLVPKLTPTEECVDVPKEVCTRQRTNPRKVKKPVVKKWCYIPSEESGLA